MIVLTGRADETHRHKWGEIARRIQRLEALTGEDFAGSLERAGDYLARRARRARASKRGKAVILDLYVRVRGTAFRVILEGECPRGFPLSAGEAPPELTRFLVREALEGNLRFRVKTAYDIEGNPDGGTWGGVKL